MSNPFKTLWFLLTTKEIKLYFCPSCKYSIYRADNKTIMQNKKMTKRILHYSNSDFNNPRCIAEPICCNQKIVLYPDYCTNRWDGVNCKECLKHKTLTGYEAVTGGKT